MSTPENLPEIASTVHLRVGLSTSKGPLSALIRWATRSRVSHAFLTWQSDTLGQEMVLQATSIGLHLCLWKKWRRHNRLVASYSVLVPETVQLVALRALSAELGAEYDTFSVLHFLQRRWAKRARNPLSSPRKLICSEAVARFLKGCGIDLFRDPSSFTPADLDLTLAGHPELFELVEGTRPKARR